MKSILIAISMFVLSVGANAEVETKELKELVSEGQIISVSGWLNLMPGPVSQIETMTVPVEVSLIAYSGGCTNADSFDLSVKRLNSKTYQIVAKRVKPDLCEAMVGNIVVTKTVELPKDLVFKMNKNKAKIVVTPKVDIGVAY